MPKPPRLVRGLLGTGLLYVIYGLPFLVETLRNSPQRSGITPESVPRHSQFLIREVWTEFADLAQLAIFVFGHWRSLDDEAGLGNDLCSHGKSWLVRQLLLRRVDKLPQTLEQTVPSSRYVPSRPTIIAAIFSLR